MNTIIETKINDFISFLHSESQYIHENAKTFYQKIESCGLNVNNELEKSYAFKAEYNFLGNDGDFEYTFSDSIELFNVIDDGSWNIFRDDDEYESNLNEDQFIVELDKLKEYYEKKYFPSLRKQFAGLSYSRLSDEDHYLDYCDRKYEEEKDLMLEQA